jgi:uncharacterized protein YukJ
LIYAFGAQYSDGTGTHDAHMNQGNPPIASAKIMESGGTANQWMALFIAFQGQSWNTDANGNPV